MSKCIHFKINFYKALIIAAFILTVAQFPMRTALATAKNPSLKDARTEIYQLTYGHIAARAMHIAAHYKLFDQLWGSYKSVEVIAKNAKMNAKNLKVLLMVLANHHVLSMNEKGEFTLNKHYRILLSTASDSLQPSIAKEFDERRWQSLGNADIAIKDNLNTFKYLFNETFYEYLARDPKAAEVFNKGMKNFSEKEDMQIPQIYDFSSFQTICDVGGGSGSLMSKMLKTYPNMQGLLFDLEEAITQAQVLQDKRFRARVHGIIGDFFNELPKADAFIIKRVLHNWEDNQCISILTNSVNALKNKQLGRVFIIEKVMPKIADGSMFIDTALMGMALGSGVERNLKEFEMLAAKANLQLEQKIDLQTGISLLVFKVQADTSL